VINNGKVEQTGTPDDLYDRPETAFVAGFVGPVVAFAGRLARPHDLSLLAEAAPGTREALVQRVARVGVRGVIGRVQILFSKQIGVARAVFDVGDLGLARAVEDSV